MRRFLAEPISIVLIQSLSHASLDPLRGMTETSRLILTEFIYVLDKIKASRYKAWANFLPKPYA